MMAGGAIMADITVLVVVDSLFGPRRLLRQTLATTYYPLGELPEFLL
jgi:hypothetical protein